MKILILAYEFPPVGGGVGDCAYNLAREFVRLGHQVLVLTPHFRGLAKQEEAHGFRLIRYFSPRQRIDAATPWEYAFFALFGIVPAIKAVKAFKPDVIHGHGLYPTGIVCLMIHVFCRASFVITIHGADVPGATNLPYQKVIDALQWLLHPLTATILKRAKAVTANGKLYGDLLRQSFPNIFPVTMINGVDTEFFQPKAHRSSSLLFCYSGRLAPDKGLFIFLNACHLLSQKSGAKFYLRFIGDGILRHDVEKKCQAYGLTSVVEITGWVGKEKVRHYLQTSDILVYPADFGVGSATSTLQGLACGLPYISSDMPGWKLTVKPGVNGYVFRQGDARALADCMAKFLSLPAAARHRMGRKSREIALKYSWSQIAQKYLTVLTS